MTRIFANDSVPAAPRTGSGVSVEEIARKAARLRAEAKACGAVGSYTGADQANAVAEAYEEALALFAQAPRDGGETQGGWRLVPVEPTDAMISAAEIECRRAAGVLDPVMHVWDAMLDAAPTQPSGVETIRQDSKGATDE